MEDAQGPSPPEPGALLTERAVLKLLKRQVSGDSSGTVVFNYFFKYDGVDNKWVEGQTFLKTMVEEGGSLMKDEARDAKFWIFKEEGEDAKVRKAQIERVVSSLWGINHSAILKPIFVTYNSELNRIVAAFTPFNMDLNYWIAKQQQVLPDSYIPKQGQTMISSVLSAIDKVLSINCKFVGLDDPTNYVMLDNKVKILPFNICNGDGDDDEKSQLRDFSKLLLNHLYPKWQDADLLEFINLMQQPFINLENLAKHPLLLSPERRELMYRDLWVENLEPEEIRQFNTIPGTTNWQSSIPVAANEPIFQSILTFPAGQISYHNSARGAHKFCRDTSFYYMQHARMFYKSQYINYVKSYTVDSKLKKYLPGFLSKIYAKLLNKYWYDSHHVSK